MEVLMDALMSKILSVVLKMKQDPLVTMALVTTLLEFNPLFQAVKIIKFKEAKDVSPWTFMMILTIGIIWFCYGWNIRNWPLIIGNGIKLFSSLIVMIVYFVYKNKNGEERK